jgi:hypothetical protein
MRQAVVSVPRNGQHSAGNLVGVDRGVKADGVIPFGQENALRRFGHVNRP